MKFLAKLSASRVTFWLTYAAGLVLKGRINGPFRVLIDRDMVLNLNMFWKSKQTHSFLYLVTLSDKNETTLWPFTFACRLPSWTTMSRPLRHTRPWNWANTWAKVKSPQSTYLKESTLQMTLSKSKSVTYRRRCLRRLWLHYSKKGSQFTRQQTKMGHIDEYELCLRELLMRAHLTTLLASQGRELSRRRLWWLWARSTLILAN